jgi:flagellar protein FlaJ
MAISFRSRRKKKDAAGLDVDKPKDDKDSFVEKYNAFCYKLIGKRMETSGKDYEKLDDKLRQASMNMTPAMYLARLYITGLLVGVISLVVYTLIFAFLMTSPIWFIYAIGLTGVSAGTTFMIFPFIVSSKISKKAGQIEQELPFTLSELSILASTGLSPVEIMRKIAKRNESETISAEFKKLVYKMDIEGKDLITAMSDTARETPSQPFRETLWDLSNMIHQGGDLDQYLRTKADDVMKAKRATQKEFIERLGTYSDIYITLVLIGVLFIGIGAFLIDAMGSDMMGFHGETILMGLTFCILPIAIIVIGLLVTMAYSRTE